MTFKPPPALLCDFYKTGHIAQYPPNTERVYSTWIPRSNRYSYGQTSVVTFGIQMFIKNWLVDYFSERFFDRPLKTIIAEFKRVMKYCLSIEDADSSHIEALHNLGYLPIRIKALREGTLCPIRVPMLTIENTMPEFYWLTNFLETLMSAELWIPATSATIAKSYREILDKYALETVGNTDFVPFQGHDFSMRGMSIESGYLSGMGHLTSFVGTDNIPAIFGMEHFYRADIEQELVGCSVPATEHSVMCAGGKEDEYETYRRMIEDVYLTGIISIVSDTWDLWNTLTDILPKLKDKIMARDGKVVIRPDSGDPVDIICGNPEAKDGTPEFKGVIQLLWDIFGGSVNSLQYKELDQHIGAIYGDAITPERCTQICERLKQKGFASTNMVFGIGSYTYQYNTRDTFGFALKSTFAEVNGAGKAIYKDPVTDDGTKKSLTGRVAVVPDGEGSIKAIDGLPLSYSGPDLLKVVFINGQITRHESLSEIRKRIENHVH